MGILSKIKNYDKYLHLGVGTCITVLVGLLHPILGQIATAIAARWKELYDKDHPDIHTMDGWDAYATLVGVVPGQIILALLNYYDIWHPYIKF